MVAAEIFGFRSEADFFKSVPMILGSGCHGQHWDASPQEVVATEVVGFRIEADLFESVPMILRLVAMGNIETFQNKTMVADETVGFRFEADFFKSVPMLFGFCLLLTTLRCLTIENGCCRNRWFLFRGRPIQISPDYPRLWLAWTTLTLFTII